MENSAFSVQGIVLLLAAVSSLGLVAVLLARRPRGRLEWSFALGMVGFALEAVAAFMLLTETESPDDRLFWRRGVQVAVLVVAVLWGVFLAALRSSRGESRWRIKYLVL